eukprot:4395319-Pleurochrysis_carterae.AAC.1
MHEEYDADLDSDAIVCFNFTTTTKSMKFYCSAPQRDLNCPPSSQVYLWVQKLVGHTPVATSDSQACRRSTSTQTVMKTFQLLGEAKQLRVEDLCKRLYS